MSAAEKFLEIDLDWYGYDELLKGLDLLPSSVGKSVVKAAERKALKPMASAVKARAAQVGDGSLAKKVKITPRRPGKGGRSTLEGAASMYLVIADPTAHLVEFGTEPHLIERDQKQVLASGKDVFGKVVHHPGADPQPMLRPAWDAGKGRLLRDLALEIAKGLERLGKRLHKQAVSGKLSKRGFKTLMGK
ncbi:MAG: hypothetical protein IIA59_00655 [Candidatus Marinimicrobia bacterium]|nr:hypothetical protein [Candidatus Neomarinimicrobiota bacterium]